MEEFRSLPDVRRIEDTKTTGHKELQSLSLSQINKHSGFTEYSHKPSPFHLRWIHGYNSKVEVLNLNNCESTTVFYGASNCGVLYNWSTNQMRILQGHRHMVTHIAADAKGKWLVTADSGPENVVIIWDSADCFPQRTLFSPHEARLSKVAISADAKYLLTLGYHDKASIYWWIWSFGLDDPHAKLEVDIPRDAVVDVEFNPNDSRQFILMTKHDIWIGQSGLVSIFERGAWKETSDYELKVRCVTRKTSGELGRLTCFAFVGSTCQVLAGTSRGAVMLYGTAIEYRRGELASYEDLRFIKALKLENERINVINNVDGFIVTGNRVGQIHIYDDQLKLVYWVHGLAVDCVRGLSFDVSPRNYQIFDPKCNKKCPCWEDVLPGVDPETGLVRQKLLKINVPSEATAKGKPLVIRDFLISTLNQGVMFVDFVAGKGHIILDNTPACASALTVHPEKPLACIGFVTGVVELFDFALHKLRRRLNLPHHYRVVVPPDEDSIKGDFEVFTPELIVTCLNYSPSGLHLACGLNTGELLFLDPTTIAVIASSRFQNTTHAIKDICFSCDSCTLAYADAGRTTCVYKYDCAKLEWQFVGKHRAHYKDITQLLFLPCKNANGEYKLLSLGADRALVEYDIGGSSADCLAVQRTDRVEQSAVPIAAIDWPATTYCLPTILMANDQNKYKIVNYQTGMTLATVLGPRYDHPVCRMKLISRRDQGEELRYIVFATKDVIGIQKLPLDGNPWKHVGVLGHPLQIIKMCFRGDCGAMFTLGAKDSCLAQWTANYRSVEATTKRGGQDLDPYYCLIENGRPGWLFQEIRDLFYYIQILCRGTFSPAVRRVKDYIPVDSLPDLMRALGFFPTEYEVENLLVEAKYKVYQQQPSQELDFEEFVKLYLNHRPAFGDNFRKIRNAFRCFADFREEGYTLSREDFVHMLSNNGERFSTTLSWYLLSILSGHSFEDRAAMTEGDFSFLPEEITFSSFVTEILGIQDMDSVSEQHSAKDSLGSQQTPSMDSDDK